MIQRRISNLLSAAMLLALTASVALGAPPSSVSSGTPATFAFGDAPGDRIASDGLGAYDATLDGTVLTFTTGKHRSIYLDFTEPLYTYGEPQPSSAGMVSQVSVSVDLSVPGASFRFSGPGGDQILATTDVQIAAFDDDGDGTADRYEMQTTGLSRHTLWRSTKKGGRGIEPGSEHSVWVGDYVMPWSAEANCP